VKWFCFVSFAGACVHVSRLRCIATRTFADTGCQCWPDVSGVWSWCWWRWWWVELDTYQAAAAICSCVVHLLFDVTDITLVSWKLFGLLSYAVVVNWLQQRRRRRA